ncbi:unnamed protein product [Penicillium glandicola]
MAHTLYHPLLVAGATVATSLTGCQLSLSYVSVPAILSISDISEYATLSMWRVTFNKGFHLCPTQAFLSSLIFFLNAFLTFLYGDASSPDSKSVYPLLIAGFLAISLIPFTLAMIVPLEEALIKRHGTLSREGSNAFGKGNISKEHGAVAATRTRDLMKQWTSLNYTRTVLPLATVIWVWAMCL